MEQIAISKFKATCLAVLAKVNKTGADPRHSFRSSCCDDHPASSSGSRTPLRNWGWVGGNFRRYSRTD